MTSISNMKIGRKISVVLGGILLIVAGLSGLSMWALQSNQTLARLVFERLTKAELAAAVAGNTSEISRNIANMLIEKKSSPDVVSRIAELSKHRAAALEEFRGLADSPTSIKHGADMADLLQSMVTANDTTLAALAAGKSADAAKDFRSASASTSALYAKADEASRFQQSRVVQDEKTRKETSGTTWTGLIVGSLLAVLGAIFGGIVLTRGIATPITMVASHLNQIAQGDLSKDAPAELQTRADETGNLARGSQTMTVALRKMMQEISGGVQTLSGASSDLTASARQMSAGSEKAQTVAAATEEMSANVTSVAAGMEQATTNLSNVAAATDEMTSTISEIAGNSEKARRITGDATRQATSITEQINQLGVAAREIGKVTETITEISSQTNLLALNATIEAARAGSAGKGFAVVANEIKALAQQTAAATEDIKTRIAGVQDATAAGIAGIGKVSHVIEEVSEIVASIAAAIEQQAAATKGIAQNIAEASTGVADASKRVAETSHITREVARDILDLERSVSGGTENVRTNASGLSSVAEQLKQTVARFRVSV